MIKKYFKYIISSFLFMFIGINVASAAEPQKCFYSFDNTVQNFTIIIEIDSSGSLGTTYVVKDEKNNKEYEEKFGTSVMLEDAAPISYINFSNEAKKIIEKAGICADIGSLSGSSTGLLKITELNKISTDDEKYTLLKPTSDSTTTQDDTDPIVESFERMVNGVILTFGKRKSGKYYFKITDGTDSNDITFKKKDTIYLSLTKKGTNYKYAIYKDEIDDLWKNSENKTIRIFNPGSELRVISLKTDLNGYVVDSQQGTIKVVEKQDKYNGEIKYLSDICNENTSVVTIMRVAGYVLVIAKILIPLLLIIFGVISFSKIVISGKDDETKKAAEGLLIKFIAAIVVFVLPTVINFVFEMIEGTADGTEDYENCRICIFEPRNCKIP